MPRTPRQKPAPDQMVADRAAAATATIAAAVERKAGNVAIEVSLAAGQVLREQYGWPPDQVRAFLDKLIARARRNREQP